jgi:hypothetical protein
MPTTLFLTAAQGPDLGLFAPGQPADPALTDQRNLYNTQQSLPGPGRAPPSIYPSYLTGITRPDSTLKSTLGEFLRIKGEYDVSYGSCTPNSPTDPNCVNGKQKQPTYDNNLCVWDGFACGTNLELGPLAKDCTADTTVPPWTFIDSQTCKVWGYSPRTLIAIFNKVCPPGQNCTNFGFFEIVDADRYKHLVNAPAGDDLFTRFRNQIIGANPILATMAAGKNILSKYHSVRGQTLEFSCWGHESNSDGWGISSVNGKATHKLGDWPFAGGEWSGSASLLRREVQTPMLSAGDGVVEITSPGLKSQRDPTKPRVLRLDFSDQNHPKAAVEN